MRHLLRTLLVVALAAVVSFGAQAPPSSPEPLTLVNASVVDVTTGAVRRGQYVVLRDGRIESVAATAPPMAAASRRLDVGGRYVVPGLIDAHVHIATPAAMRAALESGVTTVRSAGVSNFVDVGFRELVKKGHLPGPDVLAAGYHVRPQPAVEAFMPGAASMPRAGHVSGGDARRDAGGRIASARCRAKAW